MKHIKLFENFTTNNIYHSTDFEAFYYIISYNILGGMTPQEVDDKMVNGISCTTNKNFVYKSNPVMLELDFDKIKDKYKYTELDFFKTEFGKTKTKEYNLDIQNEEEIFIITDKIKPLSNYLVSIKFNDSNFVLTDDILEIMNTNFNHIKIYNFKNKDITKKIITKEKGISYDYDDMISDFEDFEDFN